MAMLDFQQSAELGAQLVTLEQSDCQAVVSGPRKSLPVGQGWPGPGPLWASMQVHPFSSPQWSKEESLSLLGLPRGCNMDRGSLLNEDVGGEVGHLCHRTCPIPASC